MPYPSAVTRSLGVTDRQMSSTVLPRRSQLSDSSTTKNDVIYCGRDAPSLLGRASYATLRAARLAPCYDLPNDNTPPPRHNANAPTASSTAFPATAFRDVRISNRSP